MTDLLLQTGLSNACFALGLAIVAMVVGATAKRPQLAHVLWLLVFVKLVTPPVVTIPVVPIPQQPQTAGAANDHSRPGPRNPGGLGSDVSRSGLPVASGQEFDVSQAGPPVADNRECDAGEQPDVSLSARIASVLLRHGSRWLPPVWLLGSVVVFVWSLGRVCRFGRLLAGESVVAPQPLQDAAAEIARRLGLKSIPMIRTTSVRLSPMVWWAGGKVRIVIPATLLDRMDARQWRWVLAHELAHVRRRDHLVRWIEWLACVCFWWNPVVWWARRNLRANEELCCDALVLSCLEPRPRSYAKSLLKAVEFLAGPALRPPAMASEINSGGFLVRRFKMIVSGTPNRVSSRWLRACVLLCAIVVLPFGVARAQDYDALGKRLRKAVEKGEITRKQAGAMMAALKKAAQAKDRDDRGHGKDDRARVDAHLREVWAKLQAAVKAGKMSEKDAHRKMAAIKKEVFAKLKGRDDRGPGKDDRARVDAHLWEVWAKLQAAVKAGKMSEKDAHEKMGAIKREIFAKLKGTGDREHGKGDRARVDAHLWEVWAKLQAAVKAGKMSEKDAHEKMGAIKREVFSRLKGKDDRGHGKDDRARVDAHLLKVRRELGAAVKAGRISKEDAAKRYEAAEKAIRERMAAGRSRTRAKRITEEDLSRAGIEIRKAVAAGKLSKEEGRAKMEAMRKMMARQRERGAEKGATRRPDRVDWEGIKRRIEGAVKRGDLTREEADAKYKEIRERMGRRRGR